MKTMKILITIIFLTAVACACGGYYFSFRAYQHMADMLSSDLMTHISDSTETISIDEVRAMYSRQQKMRHAEWIKTGGLITGYMMYLILIARARSFRFLPDMLNTLLVLHAAYLFYLAAVTAGMFDLRLSIIYGIPALLLAVPSRLIAKRYRILRIYILLVSLLFSGWIVISIALQYIHGINYTSFFRVFSMLLTVGSAAILSPLLIWEQIQNRPIPGIKAFRRICIGFLLIVYIAMGTMTTHHLYTRHKKDTRFNAVYKDLENMKR